jgi:hypothetical protein
MEEKTTLGFYWQSSNNNKNAKAAQEWYIFLKGVYILFCLVLYLSSILIPNLE